MVMGAGSDVGRALIEAPAVAAVSFTGSQAVGKPLAVAAAARLARVQLEMGGKDPLYVTDDIENIAQVAAATADGAFYNNGQSCCSVERIYVHESVFDEYLREFVNEVSSWKIGSPEEEDIYFGPLTRKAQLAVLENQVADALNKGARVLLGGKRIPGKGYYFEPTIIIEVTHDMGLMKEESFGPIVGIMKVHNDEEAIRLMADTEYGLTASVYSKDRQRAENILNKINAGSGYWNCCDRVSAALPWSGRKHSGFGVTLSHAGLHSFVRPKAWHLRGT
jgi:acyl-CoA reductase-like NAD-dependent aldehyde dehydrogenase